MKLISFVAPGKTSPRFGALLPDGRVVDLCSSAADLPQPERYLDWFDVESSSHWAARAFLADLATEARRKELEQRGAVLAREAVELLAPVPRPGKLICIGLNYKDHAAESGMDIPEQPVTFSKFTTAVTAPGSPVRIPEGSKRVDYEAELAVVIGKRAKGVKEEEAYDYVLGYTNLNDVSARDFQFADGQWQRGKSCDTFAPFGEYIATTDEIPDPHRLSIKLHLNGETLQDSSTDQLIFGVPELVSFLSRTITLEPGDVIATGTPPGVGFARKPPVYLKAGDTMEVEIEGLGVLRNPVV